MTTTYLSMREAARELNVLQCQLDAVFRRRLDLLHVRVGRVRGVAPVDLPRLREALMQADFLPTNHEGGGRPGVASAEA